MRRREVECVRESQFPGEEDVLVEDKECAENRPGTQELCNSRKKCGKGKRLEEGLPEVLMRDLWRQSLQDPELYWPVGGKTVRVL